jgi:Domain of unknown function (DUF4476)
MKTFITILALCIVSLSSYAYHGAVLKIRDAEGRRIAVSINGKRFQQVGRVLTISDMPQGRNQISVFAFKNRNGNSNKSRLIYSGQIMVQANYIYRCTVDDYEGMDVKSFCCVNNNGFYSNQNQNGSYGDDDFDDNDQNWNENYWGNDNGYWRNNNGHNGHDGHYGNGNNGNGNNGNNGNNGYNNNGYNGNGNGNNGYNGNGGNNNGYGKNQVMNTQTFQAFKRTVENNSFDSGKQTLIKTQLQNAWISAAQLRELVDVFTFESSKIDVAKFGATKVIDKQNLFTIYDSFSFESSKTELATYFATLQ